MYSEIYSILQMLGEFYINKIPIDLFNMIKEEKLENYNPHYEFTEILNMKNETISMLALLYLKFWCNSPEEKKILKKLFKNNEEKYQAKIKIVNMNDIEEKFDKNAKKKASKLKLNML